MSLSFHALGRRVRPSVTVVLMLMAMGCTTLSRTHGFVPLQEDMDTFAVGQTTRTQVLNRVGPSTTAGADDDSTLYYVASQRDRIGPFAPQIVSREVVAISFDSSGRLANIERFGLEDGRVVVLSRRITDDGIADVSVIGQLLGSIGRIDAGTILDGPLDGGS